MGYIISVSTTSESHFYPSSNIPVSLFVVLILCNSSSTSLYRNPARFSASSLFSGKLLWLSTFNSNLNFTYNVNNLFNTLSFSTTVLCYQSKTLLHFTCKCWNFKSTSVGGFIDRLLTGNDGNFRENLVRIGTRTILVFEEIVLLGKRYCVTL